MAVIVRKMPTNVDKSGRKRGSPDFDPSTAGGSGGRVAPPPTSSKFQDLARQKGVDLPAEQQRAQSQLQSGSRVGGITRQTLENQSSDLVKTNEQITPLQTGGFKDAQTQSQFEGGFGIGTTPEQTASKDSFSISSLVKDMFVMPSLTVDIGDKPFTTNEINALQVLGFLGTAPITASAIPTARSLLSSPNWRIGGEATAKAAGQAAKNTWTAKKSIGLIQQILKEMGKPKYIAGAIASVIGIYGWGEWALGEAKEGMVFNTGRAIQTGDTKIIADYMKVQEEIFHITVLEGLQRAIPGTNLAFAFGQKAKSLAAQKTVNNFILRDEIIKIETGETDDAKWARVKQEEITQNQIMTDYRNSEKERMVALETAANIEKQKIISGIIEISNEKQRNAAIKSRNEDARFWAREATRQRELEAADRIAIARFWLEYRKAAQKIRDDNAPSKLNFGLI